MSTDLVLLAVLMFGVTYPTRALGLLMAGHRPAATRGARLPPAGRAGGPDGHRRRQRDGRRPDDAGTPAFHIGIEWVAVLACLAITAWRKNLLLGLIAAVALVAVARATGLAAMPA